MKEIILVRPRGFCAGVDRAISIVELALEKFGAPVYVKHAIVHNRHVVERLEGLGAVFVEELENVPEGERVIFSAHGVSPAVRREAEAHSLEVIDATCPLVTKVHLEAIRYAREDRTIFMIGHRNHVEVEGTLGEAPERMVVVGDLEEAEQVAATDPQRVAYLTQTTLSLDDTRAIVEKLRERFPALVAPGKEDICYATQNRQNAVQKLVQEADVILVVGSSNSSNSNRLAEVARAGGVPAYLVESHSSIDQDWLEGKNRIGITAGASAPEKIVQEMVSFLSERFQATIREVVVEEEHVSFPLPKSLTQS